MKSVVFTMALAVASAVFVPQQANAQSDPDDYAQADQLFARFDEPYWLRIAVNREKNDTKLVPLQVTAYKLKMVNGQPQLVEITPGKELDYDTQVTIPEKKRRAFLRVVPNAGATGQTIVFQIKEKEGTSVGYATLAVKAMPRGFKLTPEQEKEATFEDDKGVKTPIGVGRH